MSSLNWHPLNFRGDDFVPVSRGPIDAAADNYESVANKIQSISEDVNRVSQLQGNSEAVDELISDARDVSAIVAQAQNRYRQAAGALRTYAGELQAAQTQAVNAFQTAHAAQGMLETAQQGVSDSWGDLRRIENERDAALMSRDPADAANLPGLNNALGIARSRHNSFSNAVTRHTETIAQAQRDLNQAIDNHRDAGTRARDTIRRAINDNLPNRWDRFWGGIREFSDVLKAIGRVLAVIATAILLVVIAIAVIKLFPIVAGAIAAAKIVGAKAAVAGAVSKIVSGIASVKTSKGFIAGAVKLAGNLTKVNTISINGAQLAFSLGRAVGGDKTWREVSGPAAKFAIGLLFLRGSNIVKNAIIPPKKPGAVGQAAADAVGAAANKPSLEQNAAYFVWDNFGGWIYGPAKEATTDVTESGLQMLFDLPQTLPPRPVSPNNFEPFSPEAFARAYSPLNPANSGADDLSNSLSFFGPGTNHINLSVTTIGSAIVPNSMSGSVSNDGLEPGQCRVVIQSRVPAW